MGVSGYYLARFINQLTQDHDKPLEVCDIGSGSGTPWKIASSFLDTNQIILTTIDGMAVEDQTHGFKSCNSEAPLNRIVGDALEQLRLIPENYFDVAVCMDMIEHLTKENGYHLLYEMNRVSKKGFCPLLPK